MKFQKIADTVGWSPEVILSKDRLRNKTLPIGTLSLVASFFRQIKNTLKIDLPGASLELRSNYIVLR